MARNKRLFWGHGRLTTSLTPVCARDPAIVQATAATTMDGTPTATASRSRSNSEERPRTRPRLESQATFGDLPTNEIVKEREEFDRAIQMSAEEKEQLMQRQILFDKLGLTGKEKTLQDLSTQKINRIDKAYKKFLNAIVRASMADEGIESDDIPQPVNLSRLFHEWSSKMESRDNSFLFRDLRLHNHGRLLCKPSWNFEVVGIYIAKCFATHEAVLEENEGAVKVLNQVKRYYRAFGRLMIHSLANGFVLPSHVMPPFFRAYFFCDSRPRDGLSYASPEQRQVLFHHIQQLGFANFDIFKCNEDGEMNEVDPNDFLLNLDNHLLEGRSIAISSILDGLVLATGPVKTEDQRIGEESPLEAAIDLRNFFLDRSIQAVNEILFAPDEVSADVIIKNLKGKQMENYTFSFVLNDDQTRFMKETLPNLLRRKEEEEQTAGEVNSLYARRFLKYVTGLGFINRNMPDISIVFAKDIDQNSRPHAYTCEQALEVPFGAYGCNETVLETYLEEAFLQSRVQEITTG